MKMMKRTITSIIRNKIQAFVIFLVVFVLGNVLFASIAIQQSSNNVKEVMKSKVKGELTVTLRDDLSSWNIPEYAILGMNRIANELKEEYDNVKVWSNIEFYVQRENGYFYYDFTTIPSEDDMIGEFSVYDGDCYDESNFSGENLEIILFDTRYEVGDTFSVVLWDYEIIEDDSGKWLAYIPYGTIDFKVIGLSDGYEHYYMDDYQKGYAPIPEAYAKLIIQKQADILSKHSIEEQAEILKRLSQRLRENTMNVVKLEIETEGFDQIEEIESRIKEDEFFSNAHYSLQSSTSDYRYIQGPIENLVALTNVTLWASVFLVVLILSLVSIFFVRNRKHEIGILMSLGESKSRVISQFILEIIFVSMLAVTLSMVSGNKLGDVVSREFMRMQIDTEAELKYQQENGDVVTQLDMLEAYEVSIDIQYVLTIYIISILVLVVATSIPLIYIVRLKPKEIMLD